MRYLFLGCFFLFSVTSSFGNEEVENFVKELCEEDRVLLDQFLRFIVQTINGFVIYGDKPIGLCSYVNNTVVLPATRRNANVFPRGKELWQRMNISSHNKEYAFAIFNANGYCNVVAMNRKAFFKAVNENLSLFRYVLGPTLTPEALWNSLLEAKDNFYQIIKNDNVLLGILFGYGTQNALLVSRSELLCCDHVESQREEFPFLPYKVRIQKITSAQKHSPSLGFCTIAEEINALEKLIFSSHDRPPLKPCELPFFGCEINSEETQNLLAIYKNNQEKILAAIQDPDFLCKTLTKFLTTTSDTVEIPVPLPAKKEVFLPSKEDFSIKLADVLIMHLMYVERRSQNLCLESLLKGMKFQAKNKQEPTKPNGYDENWAEAYDLHEELLRSENLERTEKYFAYLAQSEKCNSLIPNGIYYKVLRQGTGEPSSLKMSKVSFHYSYKIQGIKTSYSFATIQDADPESLIPGLIHNLVGMRRGEERWIAIHPKYGYGDRSFFSPNSALLVKLQLLDFKEGDREISILPPYDLEIKNINAMQKKFNELKAKSYYELGRYLWHVICQSGNPIDLKLVKATIKAILADRRECPFNTLEDAHDYSIRLREYLLPKHQD